MIVLLLFFIAGYKENTGGGVLAGCTFERALISEHILSFSRLYATSRSHRDLFIYKIVRAGLLWAVYKYI